MDIFCHIYAFLAARIPKAKVKYSLTLEVRILFNLILQDTPFIKINIITAFNNDILKYGNITINNSIREILWTFNLSFYISSTGFIAALKNSSQSQMIKH